MTRMWWQPEKTFCVVTVNGQTLHAEGTPDQIAAQIFEFCRSLEPVGIITADAPMKKVSEQ